MKKRQDKRKTSKREKIIFFIKCRGDSNNLNSYFSILKILLTVFKDLEIANNFLSHNKSSGLFFNCLSDEFHI